MAENTDGQATLQEAAATLDSVEDDARAYSDLYLIPAIAIEPRDYQQAALTAWTDQNRCGTVVLPTGSGKTFLAVQAIANAGVSTLIVVPTIDLMNQWHATLTNAFGNQLPDPIGVLGGGSHDVTDITVTTYDSAYASAASFAPLTTGSQLASTKSLPTTRKNSTSQADAAKEPRPVLTANLARSRTHNGTISPLFIDPDDEQYQQTASELIHIFDDHIGEPRGDLEDTIDQGSRQRMPRTGTKPNWTARRHYSQRPASTGFEWRISCLHSHFATGGQCTQTFSTTTLRARRSR